MPLSPLIRSGKMQERVGGNQHVGFTLAEVLVSAVILLIAVTGSIVAFNLIVQSGRGTQIRADQNRIIDADIAGINNTSERFTPCIVSAGSVLADPAVCDGLDVEFRNSFFYFPNDPEDIDVFFAACRSSLLRTNFISAIGGPVLLGSGVQRQRPTPVAGSDNVVSIVWRDTSRADLRLLREIQTTSLASSWCP